MVALSESIMKNRLKRSLAEKSRWRHNRLAIRPRYLGNHASQMKSYYGTLSGSRGRSFIIRQENLPEAPPSGEITMRHIRLAIKPRFLGNHASHMNSYYGTSGRQGRSFRIRHENLPKASPSGEITMTSYPACNKNSLCRKPCISDKKLPRNTIRKPRSLFHNPSWKIAWSAR